MIHQNATQISLDIHEEVHYQNRLLQDMDSDFDKTDSLLSKTMKRLKIMALQQGSGWMWTMMGFVLLVFLYLYLVRFRH
jgi:hypothetical protein